MKSPVANQPCTEILLCPGPVMLSPGVKQALSQCEIGHRDRRFSELLLRLRRNCAALLGAGSEHSVLFVTGSATVGLEAAVSTLFPPGARVVVPVNGSFGQRLADIVDAHDIACTAVDFGIGQVFDLARLDREFAALAGAEFAAVAMTHHETSAGVLNPIAAVAELARRHGLKVMVDATSSAGAEHLDIARDGIDVCVTASGKCLHSAPGIAVVSARRNLLEARAGARRRSYSLDLVRYHEQMERNGQTPFTPAVPLFVALDRAVQELIERGGVAARHQQYLRQRMLLASGLQGLGLTLLPLPAGSEACSLLTVALPPGLGFDRLYAAVRSRGYVIYGAKAPLDTKYFQVSVMGELHDADLTGFLSVLGEALAREAPAWRAATA
jgi:2-aminoethylphosphonate-pyruvate transaminase